MGYFHNRPRMKIDKEGLDISIEAGRQKIRGVDSSLPWANTATVAQNSMNLMSIFQTAGYFDNPKTAEKNNRL